MSVISKQSDKTKEITCTKQSPRKLLVRNIDSTILTLIYDIYLVLLVILHRQNF